MKANLFNLPRTAGFLAGAILLIAGVRAAEADAFPLFDNNYVKFSAGGADITGSKEAFQARSQNAKSGAAGIEDLSYGYDLSKDTNLQIDGKALPGAEDYLFKFKFTKNDFGTLEAGYKRFRTFYDGAGGFFPVNNAWIPTYPRAMYVDRGNFFVNGTLTLPNAPVITFKYSNQTRTGQKDSTIWGDSDLTGLKSVAGRKILPNYIQLGERQETWEITAKQTFGNTTALLSVGGDRIDNLDTRTVDRNVGEMKAYKTIAATPSTLVPATLATNQTRGADTQGFKEDGITVGGKIETVVNDQITLFAGLNVQHTSNDISANRMITTTIATATGVQYVVAGFNAPGGRPPYSYSSSGSLTQDIVTGNIGIQAKPAPELHVELALRGEEYKDSGTNNGTYVNNLVNLATGKITSTPVTAPQAINNDEKPWTPAIDVRYTGIPNLALYGSWDYRTTTQDEKTSYGALNVNTTAGTVSGGVTAADDHIKEKHSNFKIGGNWTPVSLVTARAEFFTKDHQNRFDGVDDGSFYVLDYDIYGVKLTGIVKPLPQVASTTRFIVQRGKSKIADDATGSNNSGDSRRYQLAETIDWNPNKTVYVQVNGSVVYDTIVTSYPQVTGLAKTVLHNSDNNYWDGSVITGFAVDKDTDAQLQATYYKADNYLPALDVLTLPYGASCRDYTLTVGVKRKFGAKTVVSAKIGYMDSTNDTTGGNTDYKGPLAYVSVEHSF